MERQPGNRALFDDAVRERLTGRLRAAGCVYAEDEADVLLRQARDGDELEALTARRIAGEPLELVVGWAEFAGEIVRVADGVFVPRRRSELLVEVALRFVAAGATVVELCCGTGAIAQAVRRSRPDLEIYAVDKDPRAVRCAAQNLAGLATVLEGDLFAPLPAEIRGGVDLVIVNAPYVPSGELELLPREARLYEAKEALDGGATGTEIHRRIAGEAGSWLKKNGRLLVETSPEQQSLTTRCLTDGGLIVDHVEDPELDVVVVIGTRP